MVLIDIGVSRGKGVFAQITFIVKQLVYFLKCASLRCCARAFGREEGAFLLLTQHLFLSAPGAPRKRAGLNYVAPTALERRSGRLNGCPSGNGTTRAVLRASWAKIRRRVRAYAFAEVPVTFSVLPVPVSFVPWSSSGSGSNSANQRVVSRVASPQTSSTSPSQYASAAVSSLSSS